jgi:hypothetical protein
MTREEWYALLRWEAAGSDDPMLCDIANALGEVAAEYRAADEKRDLLLSQIIDRYGEPLIQKIKQKLQEP